MKESYLVAHEKWSEIAVPASENPAAARWGLRSPHLSAAKQEGRCLAPPSQKNLLSVLLRGKICWPCIKLCIPGASNDPFCLSWSELGEGVQEHSG